MDNPPRLQISPGLHRLLDYDKFASPQIRMLILGTEYFFDQSWARAAESMGWQSRTVRSAMTGGLSRDDVAAMFTALCEFKPDFILASNYTGMDQMGIFARFFEDARVPYVSWFTDTPRMILYDREVCPNPYNVAAVWERNYMDQLRARGFSHVYYMPLATDPALFDGEPAAQFERPLAFVGTSMIERADEAWQKLVDKPQLAQAIRHAFDAGGVSRESFAKGIEAILGEQVTAGLDERDAHYAELCILYEATRRERANLARATEPLNCEVRGDDAWRSIVRNIGGSVGYYDGLSPYYRSTTINLNSTSIQMSTAVNQRAFDCPAAGGFLITDAQSDLGELFEPDEVVTYCSLDELRDRITHYAAHPEERIPIINRARKHIFAHHTHACRLKSLAKYLKAIFGD